jgi:hypothetical protein
MSRKIICILLALLIGSVSLAQSPTGVIRLRVRVKVDQSTKGLPRKRFFLIKGSLEQNKSVIEAIERQVIESRDCYYRRAGASENLIKWLKESDCESVYCREIAQEDVDGPGAVPEFVTAMVAGEKEFGTRDVARKWLTVNMPERLRDGFYKKRQQELRALIKQAEASSGASVLSVMGDRNGTAYFTDLEPGAYVISSILPVKVGNTSITWNCGIEVKPGDLATERPYLISNRTDRNVKCVGKETPLPACEALPKAGK